MVTSSAKGLITTLFLGVALVGIGNLIERGARARSVDTMEQVTLTETFDSRASFPNAPPGDVSGFSVTFDGRHDGLMTRRTLQFPCNTVIDKSIDDNVKAISAFRIALTPKARKQAEDIMLTARNGVCAPTLK